MIPFAYTLLYGMDCWTVFGMEIALIASFLDFTKLVFALFFFFLDFPFASSSGFLPDIIFFS